ncbi:u3 small nucleolar RNA-associated protein [Grosmannia clavigera kw1407]|uniref:U3 small nucleolar RNA-associated protein 11 n=1 Tax=Grosmannia clavigera (strain kw1407 / UAMH 11150) TaxID=655863 RepID=F0XU18_GROCL|nr:u3 small nucleolar RNA-associated protein [Grosmannia clavigera kw1407]EFW98711.1 u3 small nucleolar RNA-associated protein [Grosmannia clavigera kw1407]
MSSSMRNAVQRRSHRERAQPLERKRLGLLEKHKDYALRAKDWSKKKAELQRLREKAAERNEDEFSFKMLSRQGPSSALMRGSDEKRARNWDGTTLGKREGKTLSMDTVRLLKTQDAGYIRTVRNVVAKEVQALEERAETARSFVGRGLNENEEEDGDDEDAEVLTKAMLKAKRKAKMTGTKIVFAETAADRDTAMVEDEGDKEDEAEDEDQTKGEDSKESDAQRKAEMAARLQRRLATARMRLRALTEAEQELDMQRARMAKTATVDVITRTGKRIKMRERKR